MSTKRNQPSFSFQALGRRQVVARFDGGKLTSDGGGVLLREVARRTGVIEGLAQCFWDGRDGRFIRHSVEELLAQRVYGLALGYEDLNDHDELRTDELLGVLVERPDPEETLAGKSTLACWSAKPGSEKVRMKSPVGAPVRVYSPVSLVTVENGVPWTVV